MHPWLAEVKIVSIPSMTTRLLTEGTNWHKVPIKKDLVPVMLKRFCLVTSGLTCLGILGFASYSIADKSNNHHNHKNHSHEPVEITNEQTLPSVDLVIHKDTKKGWNLEAKVANFKFAPENVNKSHQPGEGHAHLYINGKKITRIYGSWYYLDSLPSGKNKVTISLNTNKHNPLVHKGKSIEDTEIIEVPKRTIGMPGKV